VRYRQREEKVRGESPWVEVKLNVDGTQAYVKVSYGRSSTAKDVKTNTWGTLDLGWLSLDDLACVARTMSRAVYEAQHKHTQYTNELMNGISQAVGG